MVNNTDIEYNRLLKLVLTNGRTKKNRTGVDTKGVFGAQARFDLSEGFPLLTTKKVYHKAIVHELLWFIKGDTNIKYLVDNGVNIWNGNCYDAYCKRFAKLPQNEGKQPMPQETFIECIKSSSSAARQLGELGEGSYGGMWKAFPFWSDQSSFHERHNLNSKNWNDSIPFIDRREYEDDVVGKVDQLARVVDKLKTNPDDRRIIVSAWHPYWVDHCALPPCHVLFHFNTEELTAQERYKLWTEKYPNGATAAPELVEYFVQQYVTDDIPKRRLNCLLYQRSCDLFLGVPFNIASYSLLTAMIAQVTNMVAGEFIHTYGDLHIYSNHFEQVNLQLSREPRPLPKLVLNPEVKSLFDFKFEDIKIEGYDPHPAIKAEMAV